MAGRTNMRRPVRGPDAAPLPAFRTALVNRLRAARSYTVVTVVAPLGYGKTTLLSQWASRDDRPFVRLEDGGLDTRWAAAGEADPPRGRRRRPARRRGRGDRRPADLPDACRVDGRAGRTVARPVSPNFSLARLRAAGRLLELGPRDLAMTRREAGALLKTHGTHANERELTDLLDRTEGWAAGIAHAAASRELHSPATLDGNGITRAFFREECLAELTPALRTFLRRTSVLDRMSAALCDAVLERSGSARELEALDRLGLFLVPLDHRGEWYRHHHLLRRELASDLAETEPELVPVLHRRASAWFEAHQDAAGALDHARRAGEPDSFRRVFGAGALDARDSGRDPEVEDWLAHMDDDARAGQEPAGGRAGSPPARASGQARAGAALARGRREGGQAARTGRRRPSRPGADPSGAGCTLRRRRRPDARRRGEWAGRPRPRGSVVRLRAAASGDRTGADRRAGTRGRDPQPRRACGRADGRDRDAHPRAQRAGAARRGAWRPRRRCRPSRGRARRCPPRGSRALRHRRAGGRAAGAGRAPKRSLARLARDARRRRGRSWPRSPAPSPGLPSRPGSSSRTPT